jgi:hypothetical protein
MKLRITLAIVGLTVVAAATQLGPIGTLVEKIYPKDAAKAEALRLCILANPAFNRLDSTARDACYHHAFAEQAATSLAQPTDTRTFNQVDLRQSAAMGGHVGNDIRLNQQSDHSLR